MCRILAIRADDPLDAAPWLDAFRHACRASCEYQGHGWGVAWWEGGAWRRHRSVTPIWDDAFAPPPSKLAVVHARSAFRDEGIAVENNMPFLGERFVFAFNGELHGVRLRVPGETGAARLHTLLERFAGPDGAAPAIERPGGAVPAVERPGAAPAVARLDEVVRARSAYVRALNLVVSDGHELVAHCRYSEDPEYFTLWTAHVTRTDERATSEATGLDIVCSERIEAPGVVPEWRPLADGETRRLNGSVPCCS